jgi:hypothetical protein
MLGTPEAVSLHSSYQLAVNRVAQAFQPVRAQAKREWQIFATRQRWKSPLPPFSKGGVKSPPLAKGDLYRVAIKRQFKVAAGFSLRLHRRDACAAD